MIYLGHHTHHRPSLVFVYSSLIPTHGSSIESLQYLGYSSYVIAISTGGAAISRATIADALIAPLILPLISHSPLMLSTTQETGQS